MKKKTKRTLRNVGLYYAISPKKNKKLSRTIAFNELVHNQPWHNKPLGHMVWKETFKEKK